ncbi:MAG: hypothetical protein WAV76_14185 [Bacteroidota bacterium]
MDNLEKEQQFYINENGFTLVETVVSMSLFLAVFIPLLVSVGNIMMDNKSDILRHATVLAESEMNQAALMQDFEEKEKITENFIIERKIETAARIVRVHITVAVLKEPQKIIVGLDKSILLSQ